MDPVTEPMFHQVAANVFYWLGQTAVLPSIASRVNPDGDCGRKDLALILNITTFHCHMREKKRAAPSLGAVRGR